MYELNLRHRNISENDIIVDLQLVAKKYNNDYLSPSEYKRYGKYSIQTIRRRFGSWEKALKKAKLKGKL